MRSGPGDPDGRTLSGQQQHHTERIFSVHELGEPLGTLFSGLLLLREGSRPAGSCALGRRWNEDVFLVPVQTQMLAEAGLQGAARSGTAAVVLHPGGEADPARLALVFALHLGALRCRDPHPVRPCVISVFPPYLPGRHLVRVPHLIAVRPWWCRTIEDHALWEVMTADDARAWLGGPLPEQEKRLLIEQKLPGLLALRSHARAGRLPRSDAGRRVAELLTRRYLSIRMVYQHLELFLDLLADVAPEQRS